MPISRSVLLLSFSIAMLGGCSTPSIAPATTAESPASAKRAPIQLTIGMAGDEVKALIGLPSEVEAKPAPEGKAEIWIYRRQLGVEVTESAVTTKSVPVLNMLTQKVEMRDQPDFRPETRSVEEETQLLIYNNVLVAAKRFKNTDRNFN